MARVGGSHAHQWIWGDWVYCRVLLGRVGGLVPKDCVQDCLPCPSRSCNICGFSTTGYTFIGVKESIL
jgi:hypothetical protein